MRPEPNEEPPTTILKKIDNGTLTHKERIIIGTSILSLIVAILHLLFK